MSSGGKGGESKTEIDPRLQAHANWALDESKKAAVIPFMPNRGLRVAAFSPTQDAAFQNTNNAATSFGMTPSGGTGLPEPEMVAGFRGYSTGGLFDDTLAKSVPTGIQDYIASMYVSPDGTLPDSLNKKPKVKKKRPTIHSTLNVGEERGYEGRIA